MRSPSKSFAVSNSRVCDACSSIRSAISSSPPGDWRRFADYIYALTQHFMRHGVTAFLTLEGNLTRDQEVLTRRPISQTSDNTLLLAMELADEELVRTLRVIKARGSTHEGRRRPLRITAQGATVVV